jgi:signal peptidase I
VSEEFFWKDGSPKRRREVRWERQRKKRRAGFTELWLTILVAFALVFGFVRPFVLEAFRIPSESMVPTLEVGDRVLANKFIYRFTEPERGDIVVFEDVEGGEDYLIKRVVAVAGDRVRVSNGRLKVDGEIQEETYIKPQVPDGSIYGPEKVPEGYVFVMGDNRGNSADSRVFGLLPIENIEGEAFVRFWPPSRIGLL